MIRRGIRRTFQLALRRRDRWELEVEEEIKLHLALRAEALMARGASADDAYAAAVRRFGPLTEARARLIDAARHREQHMQRTEFLDDLRQDVRFALRTLARQKAWTAVTIITLALGIGATTAVFSVVSPLILHPLAYPNADRIVYVNQQPSKGNNTGIRVSIRPANRVIRAWRAEAHSFEQIEAFGVTTMSLKTTSSEPSVVQAATVLPSFTRFAGAHPLRGRMFSDADIRDGARVALLGEGFWRERLGADPDAMGKLITLDDTMYAVIGVLPSTLQAPGVHSRPTDVWLPQDLRDEHRGASVIGRLRPGVTLAQATAELDSIYARDPSAGAGMFNFRVKLGTPGEQVYFHDSLLILVAAVALVLLVACANVAHLLIARAATRQREMAIRVALGAGLGRQVRQLITESLLLALCGAAAGVFVGWIGVRAMIALRPPELGPLALAHLDATTLLLVASVMVASGLVFGLIGSHQNSRASMHDVLKAGGGAVGGSAQGRARGVLIVSEMALSAALLVMATLLIRSVINLQRADVGFVPQGLYSVDLRALKGDLTSKPQAAALARDFAVRLRSMPGIRAVAPMRYPPGTRAFMIGRLEVDGEPPPTGNPSAFIDYSSVAPNYFQTIGTPLKDGTPFTDTTANAREVMINSGFARSHWGAASAVGHRVRIGPDTSAQWYTIVGVVGDTKSAGLRGDATAPVFYFPWAEPRDSASPPELPNLMVRVDDGVALQPIAARIAREVGLHRTPEVESVVQTMRGAIAGSRYIMLLLTIFASLALILAAVGLYGVMAYSVSQRTREIGIRIALGAPGARIARGVLARGVLFALVGSVIGLAGASWGTRLVESSLYGVTRSDPWSLASGVLVLAVAAVLACIVPTRRALAVDPMTAIRAE
jgi:predicted permease